jgi:hypothetical protein
MNDTLDDDLRALAQIDPAGPPDPHAHRSDYAQDLLRQITTEPSGATVTPLPRRRRWPVLAGAAAAVAVGLVAVPTILDGDAYGSWTDVPAAASAADAAAAEASCRDWWLANADDPPPGIPGVATIEQAELVLAERRGEFTYTILSGAGWSMDCLVHDGSLLPWSQYGSAGSIGPAVPVADVPADGIAGGSMGAMGGSRIDGLILMMYGQVGTEVRDVVAHVPDIGSVQATVTDGFFAVWAPGLSEEHFDDGIGVTLYLHDGSEVSLTPEQVAQSSIP